MNINIWGEWQKYCYCLKIESKLVLRRNIRGVSVAITERIPRYLQTGSHISWHYLTLWHAMTEPIVRHGMAASEPPSRQHILVSIKPSRPWKQCEYSRFHKNRNNLKIATIGWEPVSIIYYTRTESRMKWPTLDTTISCEGWRRHSSLIFLILLFTKPNIAVRAS